MAKKPKKRTVKVKSKKLSPKAMRCRALRCKQRSRGPRFHFLCGRHEAMKRAVIERVLGKKPPARTAKQARTSARKLAVKTQRLIDEKTKALRPRRHIDRPETVPPMFYF